MARKNAKGSGTIRKKTVTRSGKSYTYWEARITTGRDPGTGKQIQRSFSGKTQREVRQKMQAAAVEVNQGTYTAPQRMTVGEWLDIWQKNYLGNVKISTRDAYQSNIKNYIRPRLGAVKLSELHPHAVQGFVNSLADLSPATVRLAHSVLRHALEKAVELEYIPRNPADKCILPKVERQEPQPLSDQQAAALLEAVRGGSMEYLITAALFTGLRLSELLGLTWDAIDFDGGTINVNKQLTRREHRAVGLFQSPKSGKGRIITPAPTVFTALRHQKYRQTEMQLRAGPAWNNPYGLVFTVSDGGPLNQWKAEREFRRAAAAAGLSGFHFHSLRHTFACNAIRAGDDIKTVQQNLGHHTAAFTLDTYAHVTEDMQKASAKRMEDFIRNVMGL